MQARQPDGGLVLVLADRFSVDHLLAWVIRATRGRSSKAAARHTGSPTPATPNRNVISDEPMLEYWSAYSARSRGTSAVVALFRSAPPLRLKDSGVRRKQLLMQATPRLRLGLSVSL